MDLNTLHLNTLHLIGAAGLALIVYGCVVGYQEYVLSRVGVTTQGHVVEIVMSLEEDDRGNQSKVYRPVVEFRLRGEKQHRFTGYGSSVAEYEVGATVSVRYDPGKPANARITGYRDTEPFWQLPLKIVLLGYVILAIAIGMLFFSPLVVVLLVAVFAVGIGVLFFW